MRLPPGWKEATDEWRRQFERELRSTPEGEMYKESVCTYEFPVGADGTFRVDDVRPGQYSLQVRAEESLSDGMRVVGTGSLNVQVLEGPDKGNGEPLDVGKVYLASAKPGSRSAR